MENFQKERKIKKISTPQNVKCLFACLYVGSTLFVGLVAFKKQRINHLCQLVLQLLTLSVGHAAHPFLFHFLKKYV